MEKDELGGGRQIYDVIEDSDDEDSKFKTEDLKTQSLTAVRGKRGTFAERRGNATAEATGDIKNILHKLKGKFRRKSTENDSFECFEQSEGLSPSSHACFLPGPVVGDETAARRRVLGDMHNSSQSFPSPGKASATGVLKSRSKMLAFGKLGILKKSKNGNMLMPEHNYEHVDNSCRHLPNSCLSDQHGAPFSELIQNSALPSKGESDPPPIPDRPQPKPGKQQQRCRAKSITFPLDHDSFAGKEINFEKWKKADSSYDHGKSVTSALEQNSHQLPSLSNNLEKLSHYSWYWGPINRFQAEQQLHGKPDGSFLVRDSSHEFHLYSVSFRSKGQTLHTRIKYDKGRFGFLTSTGLHPETNSVVALVKKSMKMSQRGHMGTSSAGITWPTFPIQFIYPVTRFEDLPSLKHLCRFVIRQNSRCDKLHELPLPPKLISYLDVDNHFLPEAELQKRKFTEV